MQGRKINIIDVNPDAWLKREGRIALAHAANIGDNRRAIGRRRRAQGYVRRGLSHIGKVLIAACVNHVRIERGDRKRRLLKALLSELSGDDDGVGA